MWLAPCKTGLPVAKPKLLCGFFVVCSCLCFLCQLSHNEVGKKELPSSSSSSSSSPTASMPAMAATAATVVDDQMTGQTKAACAKYLLDQSCQSLLTENSADQHKWPSQVLGENDPARLLSLKSVLLVVTFNNPNYKSVVKAHSLYSGIFGAIFYCGPQNEYGGKWAAQVAGTSLSKLVFLPYGQQLHIWGETFYYCATLAYERLKRASEQPASFDGILFVSDDIILNVWMLKVLGKRLDNNWLMHDNDDHVFDVDSSKFCYGWRFAAFNGSCSDYTNAWRGAVDYQPANRAFYDDLERLAATSKFWMDLHNKLKSLTGANRRLLGNESGDVFYIAAPFLPISSKIFKLFNKHRVFVETAVVSVLKAVTPPGRLQLIRAIGHDNGGGYLREHAVEEVYTTRLEMMHPLKLSNVNLSSNKSTNNYLPPPAVTAIGHDAQELVRSAGCVYCNLLINLFSRYKTIMASRKPPNSNSH